MKALLLGLIGEMRVLLLREQEVAQLKTLALNYELALRIVREGLFTLEPEECQEVLSLALLMISKLKMAADVAEFNILVDRLLKQALTIAVAAEANEMILSLQNLQADQLMSSRRGETVPTLESKITLPSKEFVQPIEALRLLNRNYRIASKEHKPELIKEQTQRLHRLTVLHAYSHYVKTYALRMGTYQAQPESFDLQAAWEGIHSIGAGLFAIGEPGSTDISGGKSGRSRYVE